MAVRIGTIVTFALVIIGLFAWANLANQTNARSFALAPETPEEIALRRADQLAMRGGEFYKPLQLTVDFPGVEQPQLQEWESVKLSNTTSVVGVEVDGEFCAFVLDSMSDPEHHIVNMMLNKQAISVTYCNLSDCARVLTNDDSKPIPLHVGGLDVDRKMVFLLGSERYGQSSEGLPLRDHEFVRCTLGEWAKLHPSTKVYAGIEG
jgi:Protein of unknown function (DUF3179)